MHGKHIIVTEGIVGGGKPERITSWTGICKCGKKFKRRKLDNAQLALDNHIAAAILGRKGGKVKSKKKTEAARRNAKLPRGKKK